MNNINRDQIKRRDATFWRGKPMIHLVSLLFHFGEIYNYHLQPLTEDETNHIFSLLEKDISEDCKTACMLLIENQLGAEFHFKKIPDGDKDFFRTLPIYHFWKGTNTQV